LAESVGGAYHIVLRRRKNRFKPRNKFAQRRKAAKKNSTCCRLPVNRYRKVV